MSAITTTQNLLVGQTIIDDEGNTYVVEGLSTQDSHWYEIAVSDKYSKYGKADSIRSNYLTKWKTR